MQELYSDLLVPFLRSSAATAIDPHAAAINEVLADVASSFNDELSQAGLQGLKVSFTFPNNSLEALISGFDLLVEDPERTSIFRKGQGIQSTALLAGFLWMTEQEKARGRSVIWLLEEPESYLHPELSQSALALLSRLRHHSLLVVTTHALAFVPTDPRAVAGTSLAQNRTHLDTYRTYTEATQRLRNSLGIRFSDYYSLGRFNLLLEGQTDREYIAWMLQRISEEEEPWPCLRQAQLLDFGGVRHLGGFLRATYALISTERACVAVFDGDEAGEKERRDLQQFFGQKDIQFQSNRHYLSVRKGHSIEGLFPHSWMADLHTEHESWFTEWSEDVSGAVESYRIKDGQKTPVAASLMRRADETEDLSWADAWLAFGRAADSALSKLDQAHNATIADVVEQSGGLQ
jgi:predicted ATP-dependent endonuclease of OLD family